MTHSPTTPSASPLRDYQVENYASITEAWMWAQNVLYVAPCRSGKTVIMAKAIADNQGASVVLAHRAELIQQMSTTLARRGIPHRIIGTPALARLCSKNHVQELKRNFVSPQARCYLASAQTLMSAPIEPWMLEVTLWVTDEAHHYVDGVAWVKVLDHFKNARGLGVTATPIRADGKGLGRHADGLFDVMIIGPTSRELIRRGFLTEYRIYAPQSDIDLSAVAVTASGDYSRKTLSDAVHKSSSIVGDIVHHYMTIAPGELGMTFAVDIEAAGEIAAAYRAAGIPAEAISGKTPADLRHLLQQKHQRREILQLVSVDLYGEGVDVPNLEVVSFARPTASLGLYIQQFWRPGNPRPDKPHFTIIDHVGNVLRHGLPDAPREWSLDRRERRGRSAPADDVIPVRTCLKCLAVYERVYVECPFCGTAPVPATRGAPEAVDGVLSEMSPELLARLRGEVDRPVTIPYGAAPVVVASCKKRHREQAIAQAALREVMALWGGWRTVEGDTVAMQQARWFHTFGHDVLSSMSLNTADSTALMVRVVGVLKHAGVEISADILINIAKRVEG